MALRGPRSTYPISRHALRHCQGSSSSQRLVRLPALPTAGRRVLSTTPARRRDADVGSSGSSSNVFQALAESVAQDADREAKAAAAAEREPASSAGRVTTTTPTAPRWADTPKAMKGPFPLNITKVPSRSVWRVNDDPAKLDQFYVRMLGPGGARLLPDEIKWLAVTHKSFDQGRRGFNDRLAFFGRQAFSLEVARGIITSPAKDGAMVADEHGRTPFQHPSLAGLDNFNAERPQNVVDVEKLARFAVDIGLDKVLRWKPRLPENLQGSGINVVLNGAVHAVVGAVSLQHGAEVAGKVIRERILARISSS